MVHLLDIEGRWEGGLYELLVASGVVPVVVGVDDGGQVDLAAADGLLQDWRDPGNIMSLSLASLPPVL